MSSVKNKVFGGIIGTTNNLQASKGKFKGYAIARDECGNVIVDESIFYDSDKLERLRQEVIKNGRNTHDNRS